jgi:hypothetical protein
LDYLGEGQVGKITVLDKRQYSVYLLTEYQLTHRISGNNGMKLSSKNVRDVWITFAGFFNRASDEMEIRQSNLGCVEFIHYNNPAMENS